MAEKVPSLSPALLYRYVTHMTERDPHQREREQVAEARGAVGEHRGGQGVRAAGAAQVRVTSGVGAFY